MVRVDPPTAPPEVPPLLLREPELLLREPELLLLEELELRPRSYVSIALIKRASREVLRLTSASSTSTTAASTTTASLALLQIMGDIGTRSEHT